MICGDCDGVGITNFTSHVGGGELPLAVVPSPQGCVHPAQASGGDRRRAGTL